MTMTAKVIVQNIITDLKGRKGFRQIWDSMEPDIMKEVEESIIAIVIKGLPVQNTGFETLDAVLKSQQDNPGSADAHILWDKAILERLKWAGEINFAAAAEKVKCVVDFWYG